MMPISLFHSDHIFFLLIGKSVIYLLELCSSTLTRYQRTLDRTEQILEGTFSTAPKPCYRTGSPRRMLDLSRNYPGNQGLLSPDKFWEGIALGNQMQAAARYARANREHVARASSSQRTSSQCIFDSDLDTARPNSNNSASTVDNMELLKSWGLYNAWAKEPYSSVDTETQNNIEQTPTISSEGPTEHHIDESHLFQLSDIPRELRLVHQTTSSPVRAVVREFWQECEAIQASARSLQEDEERQRNASRTPGQGEGVSRSPDDPRTAARTSIISAASVRSGTSTLSNQRLSLKASVSSAARLLAATTRKHFVRRKSVPQEVVLQEAIELKECASCFDDIFSASIDLVCQHSYCTSCCLQLIKTAMQNENIWPPKCCLTELPRTTILRCLSEEDLVEFSAKEKEYATPANERWYCTNVKCLKFFTPYKHSNWTSCTHCQYQMCLYCRGGKHKDSERCSQDKNLQATLAEADLEGWRSCYKCSQMIELNHGCR